MVLSVKWTGRIGPDDGSTFFKDRDLDDSRRMAAAGAFGWKEWIVALKRLNRSRQSRIVSACRRGSSPGRRSYSRRRTDRQLSIAARVVPQSSCSFSDASTRLDHFHKSAGRDAFALAEMPR